MNYLLDKQNKRKKFLKILLSLFVLFFLIYFRSPIFKGFSYFGSVIFRPVLLMGQNVKEKFSSASVFFLSKENLLEENNKLKYELGLMNAKIQHYNTLLEENNQLKEIFGRGENKDEIILAVILAKPKQSIYGTVLVDVGKNMGIEVGDKVFVYGNIILGYVSDVYPSSSKIILFSSPGEETEVIINGTYLKIVGRGSGNFELEVPKDFVIEEGMDVTIPDINSYILAKIDKVISDSRDSFQKVLLTSPINISEIKFVEIKK
ncbi:MAG: rod shape-determining protein MreC [Candidatus Paceibacterota bacterium]|jgi:rod shape-determining protein MreC